MTCSITTTTTITTTTVTTTTTTTTTTSTTTTTTKCAGDLYKLQEKDTTGCPDGYDIITTVPACISAAQWLDDHGKGLDSHGGSMLRPSDTNGDGVAVDLHDTPAMTKWMALREIQPGKNIGNQKPYGCYSDQSIRIIKGQQKYITTLWVNLNEAGSGKHDNSAPICQTKCPLPVATTITTTTKTTTTTITTADPC